MNKKGMNHSKKMNKFKSLLMIEITLWNLVIKNICILFEPADLVEIE